MNVTQLFIKFILFRVVIKCFEAMSKNCVITFVFLLTFPFLTHAQVDTLALKRMSLEDLANLDVIVTSASKKSQKLSKTAAAMFVITQEDIHNSGVTTLPDALRMAPGIQVAQIDVNKWSVTARGFSGRFANKLLVMMDGRTIYNPLFSGVYWDTQNAQLENIERIEIIRGPGAAIWGANAVNGVINIITKTAEQTQGTMIRAGIGSKVKQGLVRYGGKLGESAQYRLYIDYNNHDDSVDSSGHDTADQWDQAQGGARLDWDIDDNDRLTVHSDYYEGTSGHNKSIKPLLIPPYFSAEDVRLKVRGSNVNTHWNHQFSKDNLLDFKFYYDYSERSSRNFKQIYNTYDFEIDHQFNSAEWNAINWGIGYRLITDDITGKADIVLNPNKRSTQLFSGFIQDQLTLIPDTLESIFAVRIEHNDYSGLEIQPTARLLWTPAKQHTFWTAFSRAVRTPARSTDIRIDQRSIPGSPPRLVSIFGNPDIDSEEVFAYEVGYKFNLSNKFKLNLSAFYNIYDELRTLERNAPVLEISPSPPHILIPIYGDNKMEGETYGIEVSSTWKPNKMVALNLAYSYTKLNLHYKDGSLDSTSQSAEGETPQQQLSLRSDLNLIPDWSTNLWFRYVDSLPKQDIKAYVTLDARLAWKVYKQLEISVVGRNLLASHHMEYNPEILKISSSQVERSILGKIVWNLK